MERHIISTAKFSWRKKKHKWTARECDTKKNTNRPIGANDFINAIEKFVEYFYLIHRTFCLTITVWYSKPSLSSGLSTQKNSNLHTVIIS